MNPESEPTQIFKKWIMSFKSDFQAFESHIFLKLQKSFEEIQSTCQAEYKAVIVEQKEKIEKLEQDLDKFFKIQELMTGMSGNGRSNSRVIGQMRQIRRQSHQEHQMRSNNVENQRNRIKQENELRESLSGEQNQRNLSKYFDRVQNHHSIKHQNQQRSQQSLSSQMNLQSENNQQQEFSKKKNKCQLGLKKSTLPPLQNIRNHYLGTVALTPNFTRISFIEYAPNSTLYRFSDANIQYLQKHDFSQVQSIRIQNQQLNDEMFQKLTKLSWNNIVSIQIDDNSLKNLDSLRNFRLNNLVHLDISFNQINISGAQLLASTQFDELIYFTVSFQTGINQECWQILLKNGMSNFPKLEAIDICNSNQLGERITQKIKNCLMLKSVQQREKMIRNQRGQRVFFYPENYEIKIRWHQSKQMDQNRSVSQAKQINNNWVKQVGYVNVPIPRVKHQRRRLKRTDRGLGNRGARGRRGGRDVRGGRGGRAEGEIKGRRRGSGRVRGNSIASHEQQNDQSQISASRQPISRSSMSESRRKIIHKNK